jgi:hypothetical protein
MADPPDNKDIIRPNGDFAKEKVESNLCIRRSFTNFVTDNQNSCIKYINDLTPKIFTSGSQYPT